MVRIAAIGLCCVIFVAISCKKSSDSSNPVNNNNNTGGQGIGANGGTVTSSDGKVQLLIPPGALSSTQQIAIQTDSNTCPQGVGTGYSFTPNGLTFNLPVVLTLHYTDSTLKGSNPKLLGVAYQDGSGNWFGVTGGKVDTSAKTITVPITHFSSWDAYESYQMLPVNNPMSILTSGTINFYVTNTGVPVSNPSGNPSQLAPLGQNIIPNAWMVNGVVGGNSSTGTISAGLQKQGLYTAPSSMPSPNNVSVSAQIILPDQSQVTLQTTVNIIAQNWLLARTYTEEITCTNTNQIYHYTLQGGPSITFSLDKNFQITSAGGNQPGQYQLTDQGSCSSQYTAKFTLGQDMIFNSVTGGYNASLNAMVPVLNYKDYDGPGIDISVGNTVVSHSNVRTGGTVSGPNYFLNLTSSNSKTINNNANGAVHTETWTLTAQ